ncbi:MAG TPA: hypothetical protein VLM05_06675 [Mycobacteriales bacterium]|nr:hypothetical protein [Mycobacteriales bacterium]
MTAKPRYVLSDHPDADLQKEDLRDSRGRRITQDYVDSAVADVHEKIGRGRPSLSAPGRRSPQVTFRLPSDLRERAEAQARQEGTKVSDVARRALEEYLTRHRPAS